MTGSARDWDRLTRENRDIVAYLTVGGTPIDLPIVQAPEGIDRDFYLYHGFDRSPDQMGTPYLDTRCRASGVHRLVFAHHVIGNDQVMFSPIYRAFEPEVFDHIGRARWETPGETELLQPVCAIKVDERYAAIQRFVFSGRDDWLRWIRDIGMEANVRNHMFDAIISTGSRCLTLATCSSPLADQRERTLLLFCGP